MYLAVLACGLALLAAATSAVDVFELPHRIGSAREELGGFGSITPKAFSEFTEPVVFRGAARSWPAFSAWRNDGELTRLHGDLAVEVESEKDETRAAAKAIMPLSKFLQKYKTESLYLVTPLVTAPARAGSNARASGRTGRTGRLGDQVHIPSVLHCGGHLKGLHLPLLWMSSGSTQSVIHYDSGDTINCRIDGRKRFAVWRRGVLSRIRAAPSRFGWRTAGGGEPGFGEFAGPPLLNVSDIDPRKHGGWFDTAHGGEAGSSRVGWWEANLDPGDCLFIPSAFPHAVRTPQGRSVAVNMWWQRPKSRLSKQRGRRSIEEESDPSCAWPTAARAEKVTGFGGWSGDTIFEDRAMSGQEVVSARHRYSFSDCTWSSPVTQHDGVGEGEVHRRASGCVNGYEQAAAGSFDGDL
jgi:hypothetical protein